ncbi:MAG: purine-binding chemotaxis protein CheW [Bacteroidales bacterium]|nr:purine-binding chemotaxis protein CheW [Bacteroidales bacterium]
MEPETEITQIDPARKKKILKQRAALYAKAPKKEEDRGIETDGLEFLLTDEKYIIDATFVVEVIPLKELTPLPCSPSFILGIINVRGKILSVVNLKPILNLPEKGITNLNRVIILKREDIELGILVDEILGKVSVFPEQLKTNIPTIKGEQKEYLVGITPERSIVFNIEKFLASSAIIVNEEV